MAFHVFGHVEAQQLDPQDESQLARDLGLAHARRAGEQEAADGFVGTPKSRTRHLDRGGQRCNGLILAEHHGLQIALKRGELVAVVSGHILRRDARDARHGGLDLGAADELLLARLGQQALGGAGLVDDVDGLVGQETVADVARGQFRRRRDGSPRIAHLVVGLETRLQAAQDPDGLLDRRLGNVDLLEPPGQRVILFEYTAVFGVGSRPDAFQMAGGQRRLEQIGGVQRPARCGARANQRMDLVDEQYRVAVVLQCLEHQLQTLFEIAPVFGARQQRTHVQRVDLGFMQDLGHIALGDAPGQPFGDGRLADPGLAYQQGVVLAPAAQYLDDALDLVLAADQRIDAALEGLGVEIGGIGFQGRLLLFGFRVGGRRFQARAVRGRGLLGDLGDAV